MNSLCEVMRSLSEEMDEFIKEMRTIRLMAKGLLAMIAVDYVLVLVILIQVRSM